MSSIRDNLAIARDRRQVPAFSNGSIRDLGEKLGISRPISLKKLDNALKNLPAAVLTFSSGTLGPSTVTASAQVGLQSDGMASFRGSIHESGLVGHFYVFAAAFLDVKDASGATLIFSHDGNIKGDLDLGSADDKWDIAGFNHLVADQWDIIKKGNVEFKLEVNTDGFQVIESVLVGIFEVVGVVVAAVFLGDPCTQSTWSPNDESGAPGPVLHIEHKDTPECQ